MSFYLFTVNLSWRNLTKAIVFLLKIPVLGSSHMSHLLTQTIHDSNSNLYKWHRETIKCFPNVVGMSLKLPMHNTVCFLFFKEFIIGSKLRVKLLQILRTDDFLKRYFLHTALLLRWANASKCGQYYFQTLLAVTLLVVVSPILPVCPWLFNSQLLAN